MSPRNPEKDQLQRQLRKKQIVEAAFTIFSKHGIEACKIRGIAKFAGLSHGHVYNFFESKEELPETPVRRSQQTYTDMLTNARTQPGDALDTMFQKSVLGHSAGSGVGYSRRAQKAGNATAAAG